MPKILLVDDEPDLVEILKHRIEANSYETIIAYDGATCLEKAQTEIPDIILLDLVMPGMNGYEACRRLKEIPEIKDIPVILFTASYAQKSVEDKAKELGAFDYIMKPFDPEELLKKIARALKSRRRG